MGPKYRMRYCEDKEYRTMTSAVQDSETSLKGSTQAYEITEEHLHPAARQHVGSHMAWPGEAAREGFLEQADHVLKVGKEPDWQRGNGCTIYKITKQG